MEKGGDDTEFPLSLLGSIFKKYFKDSSSKYREDSLRASSEYFRLFVEEALHRAARVAQSEGSESVRPEHVEKIIPQLLLDF